MQILKKTILFALCVFSTSSWAQNSNVTVGGCSIVAVNANIAGSILHCNPPRGLSSSDYLIRCTSSTDRSTVVLGPRKKTEEIERACLGVLQNFAETADLCEKHKKNERVKKIKPGDKITSETRDRALLNTRLYFNCANYIASVRSFRHSLLYIHKNECQTKREIMLEREGERNCVGYEKAVSQSGLQTVALEEIIKDTIKLLTTE